MATQQLLTPSRTVGGASAAANVLVVFGITVDLARVMTFHSLYRLEQRGYGGAFVTRPSVSLSV